jgi:hypothetical protein
MLCFLAFIAVYHVSQLIVALLETGGNDCEQIGTKLRLLFHGAMIIIAGFFSQRFDP